MKDREDDTMMDMDMDTKAYKDVIEAIKKLASDAMLDGMDEDEALVAEVDIKTMDSEDAEDMMEDSLDRDMEEERPKVGTPSMDDEDEEDDEGGE